MTRVCVLSRIATLLDPGAFLAILTRGHTILPGVKRSSPIFAATPSSATGALTMWFRNWSRAAFFSGQASGGAEPIPFAQSVELYRGAALDERLCA